MAPRTATFARDPRDSASSAFGDVEHERYLAAVGEPCELLLDELDCLAAFAENPTTTSTKARNDRSSLGIDLRASGAFLETNYAANCIAVL